MYDHRMEVMGRPTHSTLGEGSTGCGFCVHAEYALGDVYLDWSDSFLGERSLGEGRPGGKRGSMFQHPMILGSREERDERDGGSLGWGGGEVVSCQWICRLKMGLGEAGERAGDGVIFWGSIS